MTSRDDLKAVAAFIEAAHENLISGHMIDRDEDRQQEWTNALYAVGELWEWVLEELQED